MSGHGLRAALAGAALAVMLCGAARAQDDGGGDDEDTPKVEVGAHYSMLRFHAYDQTPAVGGRLTYNFSKHFAAEAEVNVFPFKVFGDGYVTGGRPFQTQFGVKAGKRFRRFGLFAKLRPGLLTFSETFTVVPSGSFIGFDGRRYPIIDFVPERKTHLTLDVGGVLEVYPSRRLFARLDVGHTLIRYGRHKEYSPDPFDATVLPIAPAPVRYAHTLQFNVGVGVRLHAPRGDDDAGARAGGSGGGKKGVPKVEAGAHFTSLSFSPIRQISGSPIIFGDPLTTTEMGIGGRFTYNFTRHVAGEAEVNFLPRERGVAAGAAGRVVQGQFGVKAGRRFGRFGVFGKARPGFVSFSHSLRLVRTEPFTFFGEQLFFGVFDFGRRTFFSGDVGGVLELYPSRRVVVRFDAGDTIIRYGARHTDGLSVRRPIITAPPETRHNFQFTSGVGFRFW